MGCSSSKAGSYSQVPAKSPSTGSIVNHDETAVNASPTAKGPDPKSFQVAPDADGLETVAPTARTQLLPKVEDVELAEDPVEEVKEASAPWGRFMMLWFCCTLASGILPGQALFAKQFADAGVFSSTCNKDEDTCKDQYLALTGIFSVGQSLAYGFSAPIGLLYDRYGAMVVGTWGALICAVGLLFVTTSVWGGSNGMDAATSWLFILGVFTCDFGSMLNSFSFMGLIWHFPGRQTVVIALINATYQASALLPLLLQAGMDQWHAPLAPFMFCWTVVVFITIYGCYRLIPTQKEYYEQAKKILGLPLPRAPTDMKVCEMLKRAMEVLQQKKEEHIFSGIALAIGFALPGYYASMTAPYGEALFGHKSDGQKLAELNVLCTSVVGLALAPFSGTIGDIFGLEAICGGAMALFISLFTIFISRYLLMYSPPNRYGAVQGMYTLGVICIATPWSMGGLAATAVLPPGLNAYLIPMMTFGVSGVVGLLLYGAYFRANPPPAVPPLLPEDEAELAKSFGCGTLEQVMEITSLNRTDLLKKMSSTDPQVIQSLMKSIDTEKMMEVMSRRSVDDIADMMETAEDDEDEAADAPETPSNAAASAAAPSAPPAADAAETPIRARGKYLVRVVAAGDKEAVKQYLLTEPVDDMWQTTLDMEEWQTPAEQKQMDKDFNKLIPGKEFASILRQRPELKKFVSQVMKREMNRKIAALTGRKKK